MSTLKCATWNVNSLRVRLPHVQRFWAEVGPDVLLLQETKTEDATFPCAAFEEMGAYVAFHGQKTYNGVAIVSRFPLRDVCKGFENGDLEGQARYISATIDTLQGAVRVASVYVPNGESLTSPKFDFKARFYGELKAQILEEIRMSPAFVLGGDFNIAADERDVPNPAKAMKDVLFTPQEQEWLADLQAETGVRDAFRLICADAGVYSWWDYRTYGRNPNSGMRIDYMMVSPAMQGHVRAVRHMAEERGREQPSDHVPVVLELGTVIK